MRRALAPLLAALVALGAIPASPALAAPTSDAVKQAQRESKKKFDEGQKAFKAGDYVRAADAFEEAYKIKPHHSALVNAALARERAGDLAKAANLYFRYLKEAPPTAKDRNKATTAMKDLSKKLGQFEVHPGDGVSDVKLDGDPVVLMTVFVNPGTHVFAATQGGKPFELPQSVEAGVTASVALVPPPEEPPPQQAPPTNTAGTDIKPTIEKPKESHGVLPPIVVFIGGGLTLVAGGLTIASGLDTLHAKSSFETTPTQAELDSGKSKQLRTNILLGTTVVLGVLTGVAAIWLVDWHGGRSSAGGATSSPSRVQVGVGFESVMVRGSF